MDEVVAWLMEGDPAIRWQVTRDLLDAAPGEVAAERERVAKEGWGAELLSRQEPGGGWGGGLYGPKWVSAFYTLLELRDLGLPGDNEQGRRAATLLLETGFRPRDGGMGYGGDPSKEPSETCITGMGLSMLATFEIEDERLEHVAGNLLTVQMDDGGWNCARPRGATHASFHTTISALEGLAAWRERGGDATGDIAEAEARGREFLLAHRMFRSHRTGEVVKDEFTRFHFPPRWHYDVLRGLDYFRRVDAQRDERLEDAIALVRSRRGEDGRWTLPAGYRARVHFEYEKAGKASRWNTLRCLRVLRWWGEDLAHP